MSARKQSSITSLLMLGVLSATLIYSVLFFALISTQLGNTLDLLRLHSLDEQARQVADYLVRSNLNTRENAIYNSSSNYQYVVHDARTGAVVLHSPAAYMQGFPQEASAGGKGLSFQFFDPQGRRFIGTSIRKNFGRHSYIIQIAQTEQSINDFSDILSRSFLQKISLLGVPFLFVLLLVIAFSIKLIMGPVTKALKETREISFANPEIRIDDSALPQEIRPLAQAVNAALDRLESGIRAQKDFIANAAHELRTPLTILRTHVDLLEDKEVAGRMRDDVDYMSRLVAQLLDTARLESPEPLQMHTVDLAAIVREISQAMWPLMVRDEREFSVRGVDLSVYVRGNHDAIFRALRNLLENALKYSPLGSPIILTLSGNEISVRDFGKGIADGEAKAIFRKFNRKDMQPGAGAGLGLFIVHKIMALHNGTATAENAPEPGPGAIFTLRFPDGV